MAAEVVARVEPTTCTCGGTLVRAEYPPDPIHRQFLCDTCGYIRRVRMDFAAAPPPLPPLNLPCTCSPILPWDADFCPKHG